MAVETKTEIESLADIVRLAREKFGIRKSWNIKEEAIILNTEERSLIYKADTGRKYDDIEERMNLLMPQLKKTDNLVIVYKSQEQQLEEFKEFLKPAEECKEMQQIKAQPKSGEYTFEINGNMFRSRTLLIPYEKRLREELDSLAKVGLDITKATYFFRID